MLPSICYRRVPLIEPCSVSYVRIVKERWRGEKIAFLWLRSQPFDLSRQLIEFNNDSLGLELKIVMKFSDISPCCDENKVLHCVVHSYGASKQIPPRLRHDRWHAFDFINHWQLSTLQMRRKSRGTCHYWNRWRSAQNLNCAMVEWRYEYLIVWQSQTDTVGVIHKTKCHLTCR